MPALAEVFMRLRVDSSQVKRDVEDGVNRVDTKGAGTKAGADYGRSFGESANKEIANWQRSLGSTFGKAQSGAPWWTALLGLAPAATSLAGVAGGAAIGLSGAGIAGGGALAAFGVVAKGVLSDAEAATKKVQAAQDKYNASIASGVSQAKAYKTEQQAIAQAYAGMSQQQVTLSQQLGGIATAWKNIKDQLTPLVAGALQPWLRTVVPLMRDLVPVVQAVSPVIHTLGTDFAGLVNSDSFKQFRDFIAGTGSMAVGAIGHTLIDFIDAFIKILPQFNPLIGAAIGWIYQLGPAVDKWAGSKATADHITAFMDWFKTNGPAVGGLLKNVGGALKALSPGLTSGGAAEISIISTFLGFVAKLPPSFAKPITDVALAMLTLNKLGVLNVGVKLAGKVGGALAETALGKALISGAGSLALPVTLAVAAITGLSLIKDKQGGGSLLAPKASDLGFNGSWAKDISHWYDVLNQQVLSIWDKMLSETERLLKAWGPHVVAVFTGVWHDITHVWDLIYGATIGVVIRIGHDVETQFNSLRHSIAVIFDGVRGDIAHVWSSIEAVFTNALALIGRGVTAAWNAISSTTRTIWNGISVFFSGLWSGVRSLFTTSVNGIASVLSSAWNGMRNVASSVWNGVLGFFRTIWSGLTNGFQAAVSGVTRIWDTIKAAAMVPVQFVVGTVYNKGIVPVVDAIAGIAGLHPLNAISGFAGGTGGAPAGWAWVGEQGPELVRMTGGEVVLPHSQSMATGLWGGLAGFAAGTTTPVQPGRLGGLQGGDALAGVAGVPASIANLVKKGIGALRQLAGDALAAGINAVMNPLLGAIPGTNTALGGYIKTDVQKVVGDFVSWVKGKTQPAAIAPGGVYLGPGSSNYAADITTVLKQLGLPLSLVGNWLRQIQTESGGNLSAVNRTDSNAVAGHPSVGLLQLIPSTFAAFAGPYRNTPPLVNYGGGLVSLNPMAQIYAAIRYAATRYDGAAMANVIGQGHGYANGGWITEPMSAVGLRSGRHFTLGEREAEYVTPASKMGRGGSVEALLGALLDKIDRQTEVIAATPRQTGAHVGGAISGAAHDASFDRRYR